MDNNLLCSVVHNDFEKIIDTVMWISNNYILKFNVILNRYNDRFGRQNYHKEIMYQKSNSQYNCINIDRNFDYFLTIESVKKDQDGLKNNVMIRNSDIYMLKYKLSLVEQWFTSENNKNMFAKKNNRIFMPRAVEPIKLSNLAGDKYLEWEPSIFECNNGDQLIGVNMFIGSSYDKTFIPFDRFMAFKYMIDTFNMYQNAIILLNYIGRPEVGTNMYSMADSFGENIGEGVHVKKNISNNNSLSFFDRVGKTNK